MPVYEYKCLECCQITEKRRSMTDRKEIFTCEKCPSMTSFSVCVLVPSLSASRPDMTMREN